MKILHAFPFFSIKFAGGTSDLMYKLVKAQKKVGLNPVISCGDYRYDEVLAETAKGVSFSVEKSWFDRAGFSIMFNLSSRLEKELIEIDIVHMHVFRTFQNVILYKFCVKYNIPYVIDAHGAVPYAKNKRLLKWFFDFLIGRKMLREASYVIAETEVGVKEYLAVEPSIRLSRLKILSPPFDVDEFKELPVTGNFRKTIGLNSTDPIICFLGRLHYIKGNDFLIRGFVELLHKEPNAKLVFVGGDDGHEQKLRSLVGSLKITQNVVFAGFMSGHQKNEALIDSSIVAQMSRKEAGAWAPFEAVLCGTPIIVTEHTGSGLDVKNIDAGETVELDNVESLGEKLFEILNNYDLAKSRTLKAKEYIEEHLSFNGRIHEYTDLYTAAQNAVNYTKTSGVI